MGNSCTAPSCGKRFRSCCSRYCCCDWCPCKCCSEPKFGHVSDNSVVTSSPISMGLVVAPTDDTTDHCKCHFWHSMPITKTHKNTLIFYCDYSNNRIEFYLHYSNECFCSLKMKSNMQYLHSSCALLSRWQVANEAFKKVITESKSH